MDMDIKSDVQQFHSLHPNKKLAILGIIFIVTISSIFLGVYLNKNNQQQAPTAQQPSETLPSDQETGSTTLSLSPVATSVQVGEETQVSVLLGKSSVQAVDVVVTFDPTMFEASNIVNGDVYEDMLIKKVEDGKVTVSAAVSPNDPTNLKTGTLFTFSLKALKAGSGQIQFDSKKTITAKNGVNTLGSTTPVTIAVQ